MSPAVSAEAAWTSVLEFYEPNPAKAGFAAKTLEARLGQVGPAGFSGRGTD